MLMSLLRLYVNLRNKNFYTSGTSLTELCADKGTTMRMHAITLPLAVLMSLWLGLWTARCAAGTLATGKSLRH